MTDPTPAQIIAGLTQKVTALETKLDGLIENLQNLDLAQRVPTVHEKNILQDLATNKLKVWIVSEKGYALDNFYYKVDDGDGDRTVQFQKFNKGNECLKMTLKVIPKPGNNSV